MDYQSLFNRCVRRIVHGRPLAADEISVTLEPPDAGKLVLTMQEALAVDRWDWLVHLNASPH
jgi:hypothetical protein